MWLLDQLYIELVYTFHNNSFFFSVFLELDGPFGSEKTSWSDINHSIDFGSITKVQIRSGYGNTGCGVFKRGYKIGKIFE